jgi:VHS domain.
MSQNYAKQLESYILKSTSENMTHPDSQMFVEICNIINSRADMY